MYKYMMFGKKDTNWEHDKSNEIKWIHKISQSKRDSLDSEGNKVRRKRGGVCKQKVMISYRYYPNLILFYFISHFFLLFCLPSMECKKWLHVEQKNNKKLLENFIFVYILRLLSTRRLSTIREREKIYFSFKILYVSQLLAYLEK